MMMSECDRGATVHGDRDESGLEEELRLAAARFDPVPPGLLAAAAAAVDWRPIDAELAARGPAQRRLLSFHAGGLTIDLEVTAANSSRDLIGQLDPPRQASVEIRVGTSVTVIEADELGRFRAGPVPAGPMSLRCSPASSGPGPVVVTDWVPI
jgi:hypothetical protein